MKPTTRRTFLKTTAAGVVSLTALPEVFATAKAPASIFSHTPMTVPGVHGYASAHGVAAGGEIVFHTSADVPAQATIVRLGHEIDDPAGDSVIREIGSLPAAIQPIHPGSYVHVERRLEGPLTAMTLECWVRPWSIDKLCGLITQEDKQSDDGFALGLGKDGYVGLFIGNGVGPDEAVVHRSPTGVLKKGSWHHVVGRWNGATKDIWVNGKQVASWPFAGPFSIGSHPLRLGAMGDHGSTLRFLDGDLAQCAIHRVALSDDEIRARHADGGRTSPKGSGVLGAWAFTEERGSQVGDSSRHRRHGTIINHGTWMIGGPSFRADVPRFGQGSLVAPENRGHALRLAADDLYDCRWSETFRWKVPANARPGMHTARLRFERNGRPAQYDITFVVRKAPRAAKAPLLVLCSTNTWRAYNGAPFGVWPDSLHAVVGTNGLPNSPGEPPAYCFYRRHAAGAGTYQVGLRMPFPVASPYVLYGGPTRYSHLVRAERFLHVWLEREGYRFDLATDDDLHRDPGLLRGHRAVVLNGHSEYWSLPMLSGLDRYLRGGGNLAVFSGNSLFWRASLSDDGSILECRKVDAPGEQMAPHERGEAWHSHDGLRGGLLRDCGHPGWRYTGLETLGWNNQGNPKNFGPYVVTQADHPLFHQPEETGLKNGDRLGLRADGFTLANGHEMDIRLSTLAAMQEQPNPSGAVVPPDPSGMTQLANGILPWKEGGAAFDYFFRPIKPKTDQGGEMIWWERPEGGRVFNAGCIASGWAVHADPKLGALVRNVLSRFGVTRG